MGQVGTGWDGTKRRVRSLPQKTLGQHLSVFGRRLSRPLAVALFAATFAVLAFSVIVADPTPASSGDCTAYTTIDRSIRTRMEATCRRPYDRHYGYAQVNKVGTGVIATASKYRSKPRFSVETRSVYWGCGRYWGKGGVRFQSENDSRTRYYCR